jgi:hypothetical protein
MHPLALIPRMNGIFEIAFLLPKFNSSSTEKIEAQWSFSELMALLCANCRLRNKG